MSHKGLSPIRVPPFYVCHKVKQSSTGKREQNHNETQRKLVK